MLAESPLWLAVSAEVTLPAMPAHGNKQKRMVMKNVTPRQNGAGQVPFFFAFIHSMTNMNNATEKLLHF